MNAPRAEADLLVVGGGPAGLCAGIRAAQRGLRAVVVDRRRPPIDKACGEGLMPDGLARLRELGVETAPDGRSAFRGIRYIGDDGVVADGTFLGHTGHGIRRLELHDAMVRRAEQAGVDLRWGVAARGLTTTGIETDHGPMTARWIAGADGLHSRLRAWAGLEGPPASRRRFGVRRHYAITPWSDRVEVHWGHGCEAYVTPVGPRRIGVALLWSAAQLSFDNLLVRFPSLRSRLDGVAVDSDDRGAGPLEQRVAGVTRGNLALIGDASGYVDAITGEGLALAFHHAFALVQAIERGNLRGYELAHRRIGRLPTLMTRLLLSVERRDALRRRMLRALARDPELFSRLLAVHARARPQRRLGLEVARLAWRLVAS